MQQQILTMLNLQDDMNRKVHADWRAQNFQWYRAIWIECAELMDHHGWKWWKRQAPDEDQIKLELVDIWHFGLSSLIAERGISPQTAAGIAEQLSRPRGATEFLPAVEEFAAATLATREFDAAAFGNLIALQAMDIQELVERYVGKNVLNFFRQDNGYKDGSYQKTWNGREDNEHLVDILAGLDASSRSFTDDLYSSLAERYARLTAS